MNKNIYPLFIFILLFIFPKISWATHIVGGEMNYRCLGNDQYEITLTVFRDCDTGIPDFDDPASIGIYGYNSISNSFFLDTDVGMSGQLLIPVMNNDTLDPTLFDSCLVVPPNVCVNTTTYIDTVFLPFQEGGYTLAYQRCCRNQSILNIVGPLDTGATYPITIGETSLNECNSNAVFNEWPPIYICVNEPILFDHSATDIDGDSLVYRLCIPFQGASPVIPQPQPPDPPPFDEVVWVDPPYSLNNMMNANTLTGSVLEVDSETGFMTGTPNTIGQFVVGVCVDEYRAGDLISTTRRDFQYNVGQCGLLTSSAFVPAVSCEGLEVTFENNSENATDFYWEFNDPNNPGQSSTAFEPTFTYSDTGTYTVMLAVSNNFTNFSCSDTSYITFSIYDDSLIPDFDVDVIDCNDPVEIAFTNMSVDTVFNLTEFYWIIDGVDFSTDENPPNFIDTNSNDDEIYIQLVIVNERGCEEAFSDTVNVGLDLEYPLTFNSCDPLDSLEYIVDNVGVQNITSWNWEPSSGILSGGNTNNPTFDLTASDEFYFTVGYGNGCEFTDTILIENNGIDMMMFATATPDTIYESGTSQLEVMGNDLQTVTWEPSATLSNPNIFDPIASPETTTTYTAFGTDGNGCIDSTSIIVVVLLSICDEPFLFMPNAFTPNGDNKNDVLYVEGNNIDEVNLVIYDRWGEKVFETNDKSIGWDGTYKNELLEPDVYGYYLRVRCFNGETYVKKGNVSLIR